MTNNGWELWRTGQQQEAAQAWHGVLDNADATAADTASAHAGLSLFYAGRGDKDIALTHLNLALTTTPSDTSPVYVMNSCAVSFAKLGDHAAAEDMLKKVAALNEQEEATAKPTEQARVARHQRAKNGHNLASLVYLPKKRFAEAVHELEKNVLPRYKLIATAKEEFTGKETAATDLASASHWLSVAYEKLAAQANISDKPALLKTALDYESYSCALWKNNPENTTRIETAQKNYRNLKQTYDQALAATKAAQAKPVASNIL